jgi:hypothetical protein
LKRIMWSKWEDPFPAGEDLVSIFSGFGGPVPMHEASQPYNFHLAETNFGITRKLAQAISDVEGVESFDVFSPYRFRVAIGRAFNEGCVKASINKVAMGLREEYEGLKKILARYPFWGISICLSGRIEVSLGQTTKEVKEKAAQYKSERTIWSWQEKSPILNFVRHTTE